jgi:hypothetical protein
MRYIDSANHIVNFRGEYVSSHFLTFNRVLINQIFGNYKLIVFDNLVRKNNFVSDLKVIIFVICERSIDKNE